MRLLTLIICLVLSFFVNGQDKDVVQSLRRQLNREKSFQKRSELYDKLGQAFFGVNNDSVLQYAEKNIALGEKHNYSKAKAAGFLQKGIAYSKTGRVEEGIRLLYRSLSIREKLGDNALIAGAHVNIGNVYLYTGVVLEDQNELERADTNYIEAHKAYAKAYDFALPTKDSLEIAKCLNNLGGIQYRLYEYEDAIKKYNMSYQWFPERMKETMFGELEMNKVSCYYELGNTEKARSIYGSAVLSFKKFRLHEKWASANLTFSVVIEESNPRRAINVLLEADSLANLAGNKLLQAKANLRLYDIEKASNNSMNALKYFEQYAKLSGEVSGSETSSKIKELELKYNNEKTDKELAQKKQEILEEKAQTDLLTIGIVSLIVVLAILIALFIQRIRFARLERKREKEKHNEEITTLLKNRELESIESVLDGREIERKNIAQDLHDRLGSTLSAVRMYFEAADSTEDIQSKTDRYDKAYELLDKAIDDTRGIAHNLVSGTLSKFGLFAALEDLKSTIQGAGEVVVDYHFDAKSDRLKSEMEINIYRIIQEVFTNALKHGNPNKLVAVIRQIEDTINIRLSDDGTGFDPNLVSSGIGLQNIDSRVHKLNGKMTLESSIEKGTKYEIILTIREDEEDSFGR